MMLTEEQVQYREDLFLDLIEQVAEEAYDMTESYEMTEEDAYITSIIMEYFIDNYKQPTLKEAAYMALTDTDINQELYDELVEIMLDESIGSFVAGAVHGLGTRSATKKLNKATSASASSSAALQKRVKKTKAANKSLAKHKGTGIFGSLKATYLKGRASSTQGKEDMAAAHHDANVDHQIGMKKAQDAAKARQSGLANKIDTGISNAKTKIKSGASKFAHAVARGAGKIAGALS